MARTSTTPVPQPFRLLSSPVGKRRRLLSYIKKGDVEAYRTLIKSLGIHDNIQ